MSFRDLELKHSYTSEKDNLLEDFYIPVLKKAVSYKRITGYFSSSSFLTAAAGLGQFIKNNGHLKFILNIVLSEDDYTQIEKGMQSPEEIIENYLIHDLSFFEDECRRDHSKVLGWLIAHDYLEIKIGYVKQRLTGNEILHQKIGILKDGEGNTLSFSGSNNESVHGWVYNSEKFKAFFSWKANNDVFISQDLEDFDELWNNRSAKTEVIPFPEAVKKEVISIVKREPIDLDALLTNIANAQKKTTDRPGTATKPPDIREPVYQHDTTDISPQNGSNGVFERGEDAEKYAMVRLRDYQLEAINAWFQNECCGIFEMATGTGKTYTALGALKQLVEREDKLVTIITVPFLHLATQWEQSLDKFNVKIPIIHVSSVNSKWRENLKTKILDNWLGKEKYFIILTTHDTLSSNSFIELIREVRSPILLIGDEVHGLGAVTRLEALLPLYTYRLGLSATPERYFDELGTQELLQFFGKVVYVFDLHRAINEINPDTGETYLTPYEYHPIFVELTHEDMDAYSALSGQIAILCSKKNKTKSDRLALEQKLRERQDILKNTQTKYPAFRELISSLAKNDEINQTLVYCSPQQIETVQKILRNQHGVVQHRFTSKENATKREEKYCGLTEREYLLNNFEKGIYDVLVAIRCLDEGVDVPATKNAILMCSSGNPKEHIQRRGRVLRRSPGKKKAHIYDITAVPTVIDGRYADTNTRMLESQLKRLEEFAKDAMNQDDIEREIFQVRRRYSAYGG